MRIIAMIQLYMKLNDIGVRQLARELHMSPATLSRILQGENAEWNNVMKLAKWVFDNE